MSRDWEQLRPEDFTIEDPSWIVSRPTAKVTVDGREVGLTLGSRIDVTRDIVECFLAALSGWQANSNEIASETEAYLQDFLPGRRVVPGELVLSTLTIFVDDSPARKPNAACFMFNVAGDYDNPKYDTTQFDADSTVELQVPLVEKQPNFEKLSFDVENDF